jgi:hypothetical protein
MPMDSRKSAEETIALMNRKFIMLADKYHLDHLWEILDTQVVVAKLPSNKFGIMTTISDHIHLDGQVVKAHFTQKGKYYRDVVQEEGPVSYLCDFLITKEAFDIDEDSLYCMICNLNEYPDKGICKEELSWLFHVKPLSSIPLKCRVEL